MCMYVSVETVILLLILLSIFLNHLQTIYRGHRATTSHHQPNLLVAENRLTCKKKLFDIPQRSKEH